MSQPGFRSRTAGLIAGTVIASSLISWTLITRVGQGQQNSPSAADAQAIEQAKGLSRAFRYAAKQVLPTVVEVRTVVKPRPAGDSSTGENPFRGSPLEDFFGDQAPNFRFHGNPNAPRPGLGSGVIIDPSGIVLTNNHVVKDADEVKVHLGDGREFTVTEIKTDERSDLAVLRIEASETLPAARLGDSDQLEIGDWVLAIGNPFALEQTVSAGIISGKRRNLDSVQRTTFLQTDAAINPGNSGGPLVNLDGEVVGINTAIFSRTGGNQGIGFAIPANVAKWITPQLIKSGEVARAYMGVSIVAVDPKLSERLDVPLGAGVVVDVIGEGSPAEKAGLEKDDVIVSFDGHRIRTAPDLQELVERSPADSRHELSILRGGKPQTLPVVVKTMTKDFEAAMDRSRYGGRIGTSNFYQDRQLGLTVIDVTKAFAERFGHKGLAGVLIRDVDAERIGAQAGLRGGMLITQVGGKPVQNVAEYEAAVKQESLQDGITLEIHTNRGKQTVELKKS
jgi:serine protease Do